MNDEPEPDAGPEGKDLAGESSAKDKTRPVGPGEAPKSSSDNASRVALGILSSRAFGFLRESVLAFFFGAGPHADVFRIALRGPNLLQNLLGEQTLSASFIPIYSRMLGAGRGDEAGRFAGAILGLLMAVASLVALLGVLFAEPIVAILAPGYLGDAARVAGGLAEVDRYSLAVTAVRIVFPMTAVLVLSAWSLGVLNSHGSLCGDGIQKECIIPCKVVSRSPIGSQHADGPCLPNERCAQDGVYALGSNLVGIAQAIIVKCIRDQNGLA